ncbi:hypothetical protein AB870_12350 [Pandoraea faecigallinarum]|nr:hypothetical protein [Pandoraea faecigallinarum]AKM30729.3 hypothetical protein AB870_12350 [Pandoraea faecigallinarum]
MNYSEHTNIAQAKPNERVSYGGQSITLVPVDGARVQQFVRADDSPSPRRLKPWDKFVAHVRATLASVQLSRLIRTVRRDPESNRGPHAERGASPGSPTPASIAYLASFRFEPAHVTDAAIDLARAKIMAINARVAANRPAAGPASSPAHAHMGAPARDAANTATRAERPNT